MPPAPRSFTLSSNWDGGFVEAVNPELIRSCTALSREGPGSGLLSLLVTSSGQTAAFGLLSKPAKPPRIPIRLIPTHLKCLNSLCYPKYFYGATVPTTMLQGSPGITYVTGWSAVCDSDRN
jgi:hypothetical protein